MPSPATPGKSRPPWRQAVDAALAQVPVPAHTSGPLCRPSYQKLRKEISARRDDYLRLFSLGTSMRQLHLALADELTKRGIKPISYNTLRQWLSPLP